MRKRILFVILSCVIAVVSTCGTAACFQVMAKGEKTKTVMVYMTGADLTEAAVIDIAEMSEASIAQGDNVTLYLGGAESWPINLPTDKNSVAVWHENDFAIIGETDNISMGEPLALSNFITYSVSQFPADEYGLILWNHGGGPIFGCCHDVPHDDYLSVPEISAALNAAGFGKNKKLEFIGFDACLMGALETAYMLNDYASYMIFSQETEPGVGWNYSFMNSLSQYDSGADIGKEIIDAYMAAGEEYKKHDPSLDFELTMSCVELSKVNTLMTAVDKLFEKTDADALGGKYPRIARCRRQAKAFGKVSANVDYGLVDLGHLASSLSQYYPSEAKEVTDRLSDAVKYNKSNVDNSNGMSIFYPNDNSEISQYGIKFYESQNYLTNYTKFLKDVINMPDSGGEEWDDFNQSEVEAVTENDRKKFIVQLTDTQKESFDHANFYIMKRLDGMDHEEFIPVMDGECYEPSEDGILSEEMPERMFFFSCYDENFERKYQKDPVWAHLISRNENEQQYYTPAALSVMNYSINGGGITEYSEAVHWLMRVTDDKATMLQAVRTEDVVGNMAQKQLVDYTQFTNVSFMHFGRIPARNDDGTLRPYSEWGWGSADSVGGDLSLGFSMELIEVPDPENYVCMFEIYDVNGNVYTTELVQYER